MPERNHTIAGFLKAVRRVAVRGEDGNDVVPRLEGNGGVDDKTLSTADAQVRVKEDDPLRPLAERHWAC